MPTTWNEIDFRYGEKKPIRNQNGVITGWEFSVTYCNLTKDRIRVMVTENPWVKRPGAPAEGAKFYVDDPPETPDGKKSWEKTDKDAHHWTLWPKGDSNGKDCRTIIWRFPEEPLRTYSDVYMIKDEDWRYPDSRDQFPPVYDDGFCHTFDVVDFGSLFPTEPPPMYALSFPVLRPMALDRQHKGKAEVQVTGIAGLADMFEVAGIFPPLNKPFPLAFGDRNSWGAVFLRQTAHAEFPQQFYVQIRQQVVSPKRFAAKLHRVAGASVRVEPARR